MSHPEGLGPDASSSPQPAGDGSTKVAGDKPGRWKKPEVTRVCTRNRNTIKKMLRCAVSVLFVGDVETFYASGFVLMSEDGGAFIFTRRLNESNPYTEIHVRFYGSSLHQPATMVCGDKEFIVIVADYPIGSPPDSVAQPQNEVTYEQCCTIATVSGTKLHAKVKSEFPHFVGRLGLYHGQVLTPDCTASFYSNHAKAGGVLEGSGRFFMVSCPYKDTMVTPDNIDEPAENHTCKTVVGAPVLRSDGQLLGALASCSSYFDVKYSLHYDEMVVRIGKMEATSEEGLDLKEKLRRFLDGIVPH